jgi:ferric-dicitrate binding protein FerR (iron transport regulator)
MTTKSTYSLGLALVLSCSLALPTEMAAVPQGGGQRAGEVSRVIPAVNIGRGGKTIGVSAKTVVEWQDTINTQASARVRVGLDDGSVLNVGSDSSMKVIKHDSAAQQTDLELTYGKLRAQAQKIAKPDGKFEVHTPAGVAGVVGTDLYVEYQNGVMNVIVFEGFVKVCNLLGQCVVVKPGQMTTVRNTDNSAPPAVVQAPQSLLTSATTDTNTGGGNLGLAATNAVHVSKLTILVVAVVAAIPAAVIPVVSSHGKGTPAKPPACTVGGSGPQPRCQ